MWYHDWLSGKGETQRAYVKRVSENIWDLLGTGRIFDKAHPDKGKGHEEKLGGGHNKNLSLGNNVPK